jgi:hypothetical protein
MKCAGSGRSLFAAVIRGALLTRHPERRIDKITDAGRDMNNRVLMMPSLVPCFVDAGWIPNPISLQASRSVDAGDVIPGPSVSFRIAGRGGAAASLALLDRPPSRAMT